jgi:hypothetical protein
MVHKELTVHKDHKVPMVIKEQMVHKELTVYKVLKVLKEQTV